MASRRKSSILLVRKNLSWYENIFTQYHHLGGIAILRKARGTYKIKINRENK